MKEELRKRVDELIDRDSHAKGLDPLIVSRSLMRELIAFRLCVEDAMKEIAEQMEPDCLCKECAARDSDLRREARDRGDRLTEEEPKP